MVGSDIKPENFELAARVVARYGQGSDAEKVKVYILVPDDDIKIMNIKPVSVEQVYEEWHVRLRC